MRQTSSCLFCSDRPRCSDLLVLRDDRCVETFFGHYYAVSSNLVLMHFQWREIIDTSLLQAAFQDSLERIPMQLFTKYEPGSRRRRDCNTMARGKEKP